MTIARLEDLRQLTDKELIDSTRRAVDRETQARLETLYHLIEVERRRVHLERGHGSMLEFAMRELGYPRGAAQRRLACARAMKKFPIVREAVESGRLSMSAIEILARVLDADNVEEVLDEAAGTSQEDLRKLAARYRPENPVPDRVDPIAVSADGKIEELFRIVMAIGPETMEKLEQVKHLLSGKYPGPGELTLEVVLGDLLEVWLEKNCPIRRTERREARRAKVGREEVEAASVEEVAADEVPVEDGAPAAWCPKRFISQELRDQVYVRDGGCCSYVSADGRRCGSRWEIHIDHVVPFARMDWEPGLDDLRMYCGAHNRDAARREFGDEKIDREISARRRGGASSVNGTGDDSTREAPEPS